MAASGAGVTVLAPNGRRQVVKVTAGTPLLQVLEEVCKKQNFNPREYNLKFQRTVLDLSLQWRFANLPNNAKLEMVSCSMQRAGAECSKVRVALQLVDGTRLQDEFQCSKTLWDILVSFPQTKVCLDEVPPGSVAVCIYMRDEVSGESLLKQTSLLSLGLTGGSAIIRFVVRKNDPSGSRQPSSTEEDTKRERNAGLKEESVVLPTSEDGKKEEDTKRKRDAGLKEESKVLPTSVDGKKEEDTKRERNAGLKEESKVLPTSVDGKKEEDTKRKRDAGLKEESKVLPTSEDGKKEEDTKRKRDAGLKEESKVLPASEDVKKEEDTKRKRDAGLKEESKVLPTSEDGKKEEDTKRKGDAGLKEESKVLPTSENVKKAPVTCHEERLSIKASEREEPQEVASAKAGVSSVERVQSSVDSVKPKAPPTQSQLTSFVPFQGGGYRLGGANIPAASFEDDLQCATAQEPLHSPEHSKPKKSKTDIEDSESESLDREPIVCYLDLERNVRANKTYLPDDFFEVTVDDVRRRFAELKRERHRLEETPLMTKALREAQLKEKLERYPKVVLRVLFPDRFILQGFFRVTETIGAVREFVESHLQEPGIPFYLFITPPRTELMDDSETLFQARLFPAAFVHFGSLEQRDHYLQHHLLTAPMSPSQADMVVSRAMPRVSGSYTAPVMEDLPGPSSQVSQRAPENYEEELGISDSHQQVQRDASKVPKWLKLSGKK